MARRNQGFGRFFAVGGSAKASQHSDYYNRTSGAAHFERERQQEDQRNENRQVLQMVDRLYSGGGKVEMSDDGSVDAKNASLREMQIALEQAAREDQPDDMRADAPLNEGAASFNELANLRTGQGVNQLKMRWGEGAQIAKRQPQRTVGDIEDQALQDYDPDQDQGNQ